jgi:hypothetical protein
MYVPLIEGRYTHGGGQMMQWLKEHNPQFDFSLFKDLMTSIEALRDEFFHEQLVGCGSYSATDNCGI